MELVTRIYASLDAGDESFSALVSPEIVFDFSRRLIDPIVLHGLEQARAWGDQERQMWEAGRVYWQPEELIDAGDHVVALIRTGGRGKASGVEVSAHVWNVWTLRDGKAVEWTYFGDDKAAALESAGLAE